MPGCCGAPLVHGFNVMAMAAPDGLWLAVSFHPSFMSGAGRLACSSSIVHGVLRAAVTALTRATSADVTKPAVFPKLLRTYVVTAAIHSSLLESMGTMTSV